MRRILLTAALAVFAAGTGCKTAEPQTAEERNARAITLYKQGVEEYNIGKVDDGIADLRKAFELQPTYALLRYDLGRMLNYQSEYLDAQSIRATNDAKLLRAAGGSEADDASSKTKNEEAAKIKDADAQNFYKRAIADAREAQGHLLFAADNMPPEANIYYTLAKVSTTLSNFKEARKYLDRFLDMANPTGPDREKYQHARDRLVEAEVQQDRLGAAKQ